MNLFEMPPTNIRTKTICLPENCKQQLNSIFLTKQRQSQAIYLYRNSGANLLTNCLPTRNIFIYFTPL